MAWTLLKEKVECQQMHEDEPSGTRDPLNRLVQAVFDNTTRQQQELAELLGVDSTTITQAKKRRGAFEKHREGIAKWLGITVPQLMEMEKQVDAPGFALQIKFVATKRGCKLDEICKHTMIVPLGKAAANLMGHGRLALLMLSAPDNDTLVCFEADGEWQVGTYYSSEQAIVVVMPGKGATTHTWKKAKAPPCYPLVMTGEKPLIRRH